MISVIIVLPKIEDGKKIRDILVRRGFQVDAVCSSGARVLSELSQIPAGIVISGYRLKDMYYTQLADYLPSMVEMVLVGSPRVVAECGAGIAAITTPIHVSDLVNTLEMMQAQLYRRLQKKKTKKETAFGKRTELYKSCKTSSHGEKPSDRGRSLPLSAEMQHGQRNQSGGNGADGTFA